MLTANVFRWGIFTLIMGIVLAIDVAQYGAGWGIAPVAIIFIVFGFLFNRACDTEQWRLGQERSAKIH